jgi:hypothetical protein
MWKAVIWTVALMASVIAASASAAQSNQISITVPTRALVAKAYGVSATGFARGTADAYLFIDYAGCAKSFSAEYKRAGKHGRVHWPVNGSFRQTSYWGSDYAGVDHACGYLVAKGSDNVLASSRVTFRIHRH